MVEESNKDQSTEQKILAAAKEVFIEQGLAGARMQDIADKAGINKALLHYYFRSKDKLFEMVFHEAAMKFLPKVTMLFEAEMPLFDKIRVFVDNYISMLIDNPFIPLFVLNEVHKNPTDYITRLWGGRTPPVAEFAAHVQREIAAGNIRPVNPFHLMMNMISMCVFPFVGRPIIKGVFKLENDQFMKLMEERKTLVADFIINSIKL
ncbi:MAG: TetR/AcrR family transcriptional regulator [Niastella sp.]|nr:TetR/AcrR family transcriptional regulator [Niastella sp.]